MGKNQECLRKWTGQRTIKYHSIQGGEQSSMNFPKWNRFLSMGNMGSMKLTLQERPRSWLFFFPSTQKYENY